MIATRTVMTDALKTKLKGLTKKEVQYFKQMWPKSGVLYITSKPGVAKSAITRNIADKMGYAYHDVRLAMVDETDVGLFPDKVEIDGIKCLDFVVPRWAIEANKRPTIIHFEELNRATLQVRNAALQILLERAIGTDFKFNEGVLMIASGNLGDEDGTDVEEFDTALNGRLIHMKHTLSVNEWITGYGDDNVHEVIVSFIKSYPEFLYRDPTDDGPKAYASPRTWTFLSDYIVCNYGMESTPRDWAHDLYVVGSSYIGNSAKRFIQYCEEMLNININDIIDRYDDVEVELSKMNRDKNSELIQALKTKDIEPMTDFQRENITKFLKRVGQDELVDYLLGILDVPSNGVETPNIKKFLRQYKDVLIKTRSINRKNTDGVVTIKAKK